MSEEVPPPKSAEYSRPRSGGNRGGGRPIGLMQPIQAPTEVIVDSVVELTAGIPPKKVAEKHSIPVNDVRRLQTLVGLTPQQYFDAIGNRLEPVLDDLIQLLHKKTKDALKGEGMDTLQQVAVSLGIVQTHLSGIRGQAKPTSVHQTNIQINNLSRADAMKFLNGNTQ